MAPRREKSALSGAWPVNRFVQEIAGNLGFLAAWTATENVTRGRIGGESGIRTHGTLARTHAFQACALSRSAISPVGPTAT